MTTVSNHLRVTLVQTAAGQDLDSNLNRIRHVLSGIGATDVIALPEVFAIRGGDQDYRASAQPLTGPLVSLLAATARRHNAWVLAGSLIEAADQKYYNTSLLLNRCGDTVATYRKIHLFEAELGSGQIIRESDTYEAGDTPVMTELEGWRCGMAICYDLRFPELFRHYSAQGANLFFIPSNFTQHTGKDHWEILLRARAIENQCFVVAPDQCGVNPHSRVESYGNSMVVGPWGEILARLEEGEQTTTVTLDLHDVHRTRQRIPALEHRKL
ncbi:MAG: carbon-nitrogen hydrolase family protein [bacterium]|jgi:nitrilase